MRQGVEGRRSRLRVGSHVGANDRLESRAGSNPRNTGRTDVHRPLELTVPIYEYQCLECGKRSSILHLSHSPSTPPLCVHCKSSRLDRLMSRFAAPKSEEARMASLAEDDTVGGVDHDDPASMERLLKHMGNEMGGDVGDDIAEAIDSEGDDVVDTAGPDGY
jgi:putative FmdB family regulatory protein